MSEIAPVSPSTTIAEAMQPGSSTVENPSAMLDRDAFLKLLVAQLKYQDPTKPVDASEMVAQSAQLTMVDRLNEIASALQTAETGNRLALAGTLVGKEIEFLDESGQLLAATVEAVRIENGDTVLQAGGFAVPLDAVAVVRDVPLAPGASSIGRSGSTSPAPSPDPVAPPDPVDTATDATDPTDGSDATTGGESGDGGGADESVVGVPDAPHDSAVDDVPGDSGTPATDL